MGIDRKRVRELATAGPPAGDAVSPPGATVVKLVDQPWGEPYAALSAILRARTAEEFNRLEPGFNRAYRSLKGHVIAQKRYPWSGPDGTLAPGYQGNPIFGALDRLLDLAVASPLLRDPAPPPRFLEIGRKVHTLRQLARIYTRRGTVL